MIEEILLKDQTTGKNIIWANDSKNQREEIQLKDIDSIKPRHEKIREHQKLRTKVRAEIFTPPDICKIQNDLIDEAWLRDFAVTWLKDKENLNENSFLDMKLLEEDFKKISAVFWMREKINIDTITAHWLIEKENLWQNYVDTRRIEITCGEAPYIVSPYNAVTGEQIEITNRVGLLDRKLYLVGKKTSDDENVWMKWALRAVQSVYGYEFQGDNLFLARKNIFDTITDYFEEKFHFKPPEDYFLQFAEIISWNFWQMDGKTGSPPFMKSKNLFEGANCLIMDWKNGKPFEFIELLGGKK